MVRSTARTREIWSLHQKAVQFALRQINRSEFDPFVRDVLL